jgi:ATP-dependent Lon protease
MIPYYKEEEKPIKSCREKMKKISLLASELKKIDYDEIEPRLLEFLDTYPGEVKEKVLNFIISVAEESTADAPHKKNIICFYGEPGTGKTRLAEEIAKILGVSIISFEPSSHKAEEMIAESIESGKKEKMLNLFTND